MSTQSQSQGDRLARFLSALSLDLVGAVLVAWLAAAGWLLSAAGPFVRFLLGGTLLFFLTGYALVAALFPHAGTAPTASGPARGWLRDRGPAEPRGVTLRERALLSFGVSVALVPVFGLVVAALGREFTSAVVVAVLAAFVALCALIAGVRRFRLPAEQRFALPVGAWLGSARRFLFGGGALATAVNLVLVGSVLVGLGAGAYAIAAPQPDASYTEFALLTENESGGYVASGYPTNLTRGESARLVASVENQRHRPVDYTVVVELQQVETTDDDRIQVLSTTEIDRFSRTVGHDRTWYQPHDVVPRRAGQEKRLAYYLYRGDAPADADAASADHTLQLWMNVSTQV